MLRPITIWLTIAITIALNGVYAQTDTLAARISPLAEFAALYEIDTLNYKRCQLLSDEEMRKGPAKDAELSGIRVAKGEIVTAYKIFAASGSWAIVYKGVPGFLPLSSLMTVKEKDQNMYFTPYDEAPVAVSRLKVEYPPEALKEKIEGEVILLALINSKGQVDEVKIQRGIPELNEAAVEAVKNMKFKPGKFEGKAVDVWIRMPIKFNYSDM